MNWLKHTGAFLLLSLLADCGVAQAQSADAWQEQTISIEGRQYRLHIVAKGETLYSLSKRYGVSIDDIIADNPVLKEGLKTGQAIKLPCNDTTAKASEVVKPAKRKRGKFITHTVAQGETLYSISRRYSVSVETIVADNDNIDASHLAVGTELLVRKVKGAKQEVQNAQPTDSGQSDGDTAPQQEYAYHVVHSGETAASIAERFGTTEQALLTLNGMRRPAEMKTGLIVKVPRPVAEQPKQPEEVAEEQPTPQEIGFKPLREGETAKVALLLPLDAKGVPAQNYVDFYCGFLLGMDSVRMHGISAEVDVFDTAHDYSRVDEIVKNGSLDGVDLIVGPIYEDLMAPVAEYAAQNSVPLVSPLANIAGTQNGAVFRMSPDAESKYDKVRDLLDGSKRVVFIRSGATDTEFEAEIVRELGDTPYMVHEYVYEHPSIIEQREKERERTGAEYEPAPSDLSPLLQGEGERVFVVLSENETDVDRVLAALASAHISLSARSRSVAPFVVLGNNKWNRFRNLDRSIYFAVNAVMLSTYHVQRNDSLIKEFDSRYAAAFGSIPTLYSYRGYDAAVLFVGSLRDAMQGCLEGRNFVPLQTPYRFGKGSDGAMNINREWVRVNYHNNFTITTK